MVDFLVLAPAHVVAIAQEAAALGATVTYRPCARSDAHVDIFNAPRELLDAMRVAGFEQSEFRFEHWHWCEASLEERPTDRPGAP